MIFQPLLTVLNDLCLASFSLLHETENLVYCHSPVIWTRAGTPAAVYATVNNLKNLFSGLTPDKKKQDKQHISNSISPPFPCQKRSEKGKPHFPPCQKSNNLLLLFNPRHFRY